MDGPPPPAAVAERGETNRWLVGIMGAVGGLMVVIVVGFQAQIDARQDDALRQVAEANKEIHARQDQAIQSVAQQSAATAASLAEVSKGVVELSATLRARDRGRP